MDDVQFQELMYVLHSIRDELRDLKQVIGEVAQHNYDRNGWLARISQDLEAMVSELSYIREHGLVLDIENIEKVFEEFGRMMEEYVDMSEKLHQIILQYLKAFRPPPPTKH